MLSLLVLLMERVERNKSTKPKRDRDVGRKYKSGNEKKQVKAKTDKLISELPRLSKWFKGPPKEAHLEIVAEQPNCSTDNFSYDNVSEDVGDAAGDDVDEDDADTCNEQIATVYGGDSDNEVEIPRNVMIDIYPNDIGLWPEKIDEGLRCYWLEKGSADCRHSHENFENSAVTYKDRVRHCTKSLFTRKHTLTGETIDLTWLCYSKSSGKVYCFICKLLSPSESLFITGFNDWENSRAKIESHSRSDEHRQALTDCTIRKSISGRIDKNLVIQFEKECSYWRIVISRCVDVVKFLCERGLALRGKDEITGSVHNGNFLGIIELLSKYDIFMANHIENMQIKGRGIHLTFPIIFMRKLSK